MHVKLGMAFRRAAAAFAQGVRASQVPARVVAAAPGVALGGAALFGLSATAVADEAEHGLHAPSYTWPHDGFFSSYDAAAIRRGHQVRSTPGVTTPMRLG
jgi:cytochrome c1